MEKNYLKNNNGISLIKAILLILVTILVVFLAYEIMYIDLFDIDIGDKDNSLEIFLDYTNELVEKDETNEIEEEEKKNTEVIIPIIGENEYNEPEIATNINHYYYDQLDEAGKTIYKGLEDNIENLKSGNYQIDYGTKFNDLLNSENGEQKLNKSFQSAWNAFAYDHVEVFYIDVEKLILTTRTTTIAGFSTHRVNLSRGENLNYFERGITSAEDLKQKENYLNNVKNQFISQLHDKSEYEKIKQVHDWLVDNLEYDTTFEKENINNIYGAFSDKVVICEGYAKSFKYILDGLGIENVIVSGTATNSDNDTESHAWNYVKIDGKWYAVDVTWDDPILTGGGTLSNRLKYQYFLKGSYVFLEDHKEDGYLSENSIKFEFPKLEEENYN